MKPSVMLDIETLDTCAEAVILSVGACKFNPYTDEEPYAAQHWRISVDDQLERGRSVSESTLAWWANQPENIREEALGDTDRISVVNFIRELNRWLVNVDKIWCQGPQFDMVIIEHLFTQWGINKNWAYWQVCDCRTIFNMMPEDPRKAIRTQAHNALADAHWQAISVQRTFQHFRVQPR